MKTLIPLTALAALVAAGSIQAQTPAFSLPSGYTTQTLTPGVFNLLGINLLKPIVVSSTVTGVSGATITDTTQNFTTLLTAGKTYILEITSGTTTTPATAGTAAGAVEWFVSWTGNNITASGTENILGVAVGDKYTIRLAPTVQELFPVGTLATFSANNLTNADKVWVPQGNGTYLRYAYKTTDPVGWHLTNNGISSNGLISVDIPLLTTDGLLVEKKATSGSFVLTGQVKKTASSVYVVGGFNLVSINPPVGSTLFTCGLTASDLATFSANNLTNADKIWVPQGNGTYLRYALKTTDPIGWHLTNNGTTSNGLVTQDFALPSGIFIQRISNTPKVMSLDVPAGYTNL